jgi:hypothetical protein
MIDAILRQSAFPAVDQQRRLLRAAIEAQPVPADVTVTAAELGAIPTAEITVDGIEPRHVVLYFHGGVYVMSDAFLAAGLASQVGRPSRSRRRCPMSSRPMPACSTKRARRWTELDSSCRRISPAQNASARGR